MEAVLIRERYKIVRVLHAAEDFACVEAVDIQDRETPVYLINLYEGEFFHRYGKIYASMKQEDCPALRRLFLDGQTIAAVFEEKQGVNIDQRQLELAGSFGICRGVAPRCADPVQSAA